MKKLQQKKHYCEECGKLLTEQEHKKYDGLCEKCYKELMK